MGNAGIAITGMGVISPAGVGTEPFARALLQGTPYGRRLELDGFPDGVRLAGAVCSDFFADDFLNKKQQHRLNRASRLFFAAAALAIADRKLMEDGVSRDRIGVFEGTSLGGLAAALQAQRAYLRDGFGAVHPRTVLTAMTGAAASAVSEIYRFHGPAITCSNGSISSACALACACQYLQEGLIDVAIAGGAEAPLSPEILVLFFKSGLLASDFVDARYACRPFDRDRSGTMLGEGAAVFVLERGEEATHRAPRIYAKIAGVGLTSDAYHPLAPDPSGTQQTRSIRMALEKAGVSPDELGYVSLHGTGTRKNDLAESRNIKAVLGSQAHRIPMSSSKGMLGHTLGACTAIEVAKTVIAMQKGFVPPTTGLKNPDPECGLDYVPGTSRPKTIKNALVVNSSFGGKNSAIVLKRKITAI
jgi:3-oxoacyl-[acyl-carrier-protein] synthase II